MTSWPFGQRGGFTDTPFSSDDPLICTHQALRLKALLVQWAGRYEQSWMIMNRLELVYLCAGRREDADRVHADKIALATPVFVDRGDGFIGRLRWWWQTRETEARFQHGQLIVNENLAELDRHAPWRSGFMPEHSS